MHTVTHLAMETEYFVEVRPASAFLKLGVGKPPETPPRQVPTQAGAHPGSCSVCPGSGCASFYFPPTAVSEKQETGNGDGGISGQRLGHSVRLRTGVFRGVWGTSPGRRKPSRALLGQSCIVTQLQGSESRALECDWLTPPVTQTRCTSPAMSQAWVVHWGEVGLGGALGGGGLGWCSGYTGP